MGNNKFTIFDINQINYLNANTIPIFNSNLNTNLTSCAIMAKNKKFAISSSDGRIYKGIYK